MTKPQVTAFTPLGVGIASDLGFFCGSQRGGDLMGSSSREICHCGAMHRKGREYPGELCSLCHYAPLAAADYKALSRRVREIIRDATSGIAEVFDEGWLTDHGVIVSDDWKSAGKAADVWNDGKPVLGLDGKPGKPSSCDSLSRSFVFGDQRETPSSARRGNPADAGPEHVSDSPVTAKLRKQAVA